MKTELCEIAYTYGADKCTEIKHPYTPFYYDFLKDTRDSIKKVLEIGVGCASTMGNSPRYHRGASLYMWRDFFPNAKIYGTDILPEALFKDERIETFLCDQSNGEDLKRLLKKTGTDIDLVIDDGSHIKEHQIFTCLYLMPLLKKDVVYVIEDVMYPEIVASALDTYDCQIPELAGRRHSDDRLIIVRNKYG